MDERVEEATTVGVGVQTEGPEDLKAEDEEHPLVDHSSRGTAEPWPEGEVCAVHQREDSPETIHL
jgi:hypothetical protein